MALPVLKRGATGEVVERWQQFLIGHGFSELVADGQFGKATEDATKQYQLSKGLVGDGTVGGKTYAKALEDGFDGIQYDEDFPPKPTFPPVVSLSERQQLFGKFDYVSDPTPSNPEHIKILGNWFQENIVAAGLPGFQPISGAPSNGEIKFHRLAIPQLQGLWSVWQAKDLLKLVLTFDGSFVPRFIRGSRTVLSNHSFGSAFDINYQWNKLAHTPALVGQKGSVRLLVAIANDYGFYWGGHFNSRKDGMHFEVAKILSSAELEALKTKYEL